MEYTVRRTPAHHGDPVFFTGKLKVPILRTCAFPKICDILSFSCLIQRETWVCLSKRVKSEKGKAFSYRDIKKVYTIIFYEHSPKEFRCCPECYLHRAAQRANTGIRIDLLQEYAFIPLDIFHSILQNKGIRNKLEAWLTFLSADSPELIGQLIQGISAV